jgi:hypothetical protein
MLYRQATIRHSLSNITICMFLYPFPIALDMSSTRKFWNTSLNNIQVHNFDEYLCEYNIRIKNICTRRESERTNVSFTSTLSFHTAFPAREHRQTSEVVVSGRQRKATYRQIQDYELLELWRQLTLTSLKFLNKENIQRLIFVTQSVLCVRTEVTVGAPRVCNQHGESPASIAVTWGILCDEVFAHLDRRHHAMHAKVTDPKQFWRRWRHSQGWNSGDCAITVNCAYIS